MGGGLATPWQKGSHTFAFNIVHGVVDQTYDRHDGGWEHKRAGSNKS